MSFIAVGLVGSIQGLVFTKRFDSDSTHTGSLPDEAAVVGEGFRTAAAFRQVKPYESLSGSYSSCGDHFGELFASHER